MSFSVKENNLKGTSTTKGTKRLTMWVLDVKIPGLIPGSTNLRNNLQLVLVRAFCGMIIETTCAQHCAEFTLDDELSFERSLV